MIIQREEEKEVELEGWVEYEIDRDYGADRDGCRGVVRVLPQEVTEVYGFIDGDFIYLTTNELENARELLVNRFLETFGV